MIEANIGIRNLLVTEAVERLASSAAAGRRRRPQPDASPAFSAGDNRLPRENGRPSAQLSHVSSGRAA